MAFPNNGPYLSRKLRFSGAERARLRTLFLADKIALARFVDELWDAVSAPDLGGSGWPDEDFYILGVQVADILPTTSVDDLVTAFTGIQAHELYNPRLASFLFGFGGQEFDRLADPQAIADLVRQLDTATPSWVATAG
jgi:hypothetical protein